MEDGEHTPPAVSYARLRIRPRNANQLKRPPKRSASPAASGTKPGPPVGGRTPAPYWACAAPYWAAAAYWSEAVPCAIAGAATSSVRRASTAARYRALFMVLSPFYVGPTLCRQLVDWDRSGPPYGTILVTTLRHLHTLTTLRYLTWALSKEHARLLTSNRVQSYPPLAL